MAKPTMHNQIISSQIFTGLVGAMILLGCMLTSWWIARFVKRKSRLDVPNERSSHSQPTATGGGLGIAICLAVASALLAYFQDPRLFGLPLGLLLLTYIGWHDDTKPLSAKARLSAQLLSVLFALAPYFAFGVPPLTYIFWGTLVLAMLWLINLYNFMDGTDGLAGIQAVIFSLGAWLIFWPSADSASGTLIIVLLGSCIGFLFLNWPPASIFMGDVGSTTIGLGIAAMALLLAKTVQDFASIFILLAGFIVDASWTLIRRLLTGQKFWQAHRSHAYQRLALRAGNHQSVLYWYLSTGLFIQIPLAYYTLHNKTQTWVTPLIAATCIHAIFCYILQAGKQTSGIRNSDSPSHQ